MWGYISTEAIYQWNFNIGFSTTRSDVLVHLSQWQYWWWFWFAFLWSFYYLFVNRIIRYRSLKMRPKIVTSFRPHGKWGDFLAAIIPSIWCLNILANSNFILRLLEWQSESSLFTIRVRARQWYWVYKFELKNFTDILTAPKNIGYNRWVVTTFGDIQVAEDYLYILQLRSQNFWINDYWNKILEQDSLGKKYYLVSSKEQLFLDISKNSKDNYNQKKINNILLLNPLLVYNLNENNWNNIKYKNNYTFLTNNGLYNISNNFFLKKINWEESSFFNKNFIVISNLDLYSFNFNKYVMTFQSFFNNILFDNCYNGNIFGLYQNYDPSFEDNIRVLKRTQGIILPLRIVKYPFGLYSTYDTNYNIASSRLFNLKFNDTENSLRHKTIPHTSFIAIKQKKYTKKDSISSIIKYNYKDQNLKRVRYSGKPILFNNSIFESNTDNTDILYRLVKKNKRRGDMIPVNLARRILRTRRTLVLPAHVNITLVTNSFDIIHSWFIPGLGIKIDCVPGRSTHHTFYIDNVGFYYGQCAEICGRYHHHMPIRVCALPFEHFLVWWYTFGLPRLLYTNNHKRFESYYSFRKFIW